LDVLFWTAAVACAIAQYFIVRAVWKVIPSGISSPDVPAPRRALEIMWVLLPVLLLAGAFAGTWRHLHPASSGSSPDAAATRA
jgi:heme/copper-type cytochrome/quinol oxidase subunit 2